jgi:valyl-tRNA synthetase
MTEIPSKFNFKEIDEKWSTIWAETDFYHANVDPSRKPFTVAIPPPNVTGILHMGHALNNTLQDIIVRYKRMKGLEALWIVGTDHAGIATQNVVEKKLAKEGKTRYDVGRENFLKELWQWKNEYGDTIIHQLKKLGSSGDWARQRFTMDEDYSKAVIHVFVELYKKGLIYRGKYIINWCPRCQTALSDEEAEHEETQGNLYHIKYPFKDNPSKFVIVATTRPETMLGDTAVAVNPTDKRYKDLIGKTLVLPIVNREIKIIADDFVDPAFGSGAVKVTPAHDPNDFAMGKRHNLEFINIMHPDAKLNENAGKFNGLDRFDGRKKVIAELKEKGLLEKIEPHVHQVGHCYRCHTVVEPYLSNQWFVKMAPLAKPALEAVQDGRITFYPDRWTKVYTNWMEGIRDWCISRQIWWGHRIPVWYCAQCPDGQNFVVSETTPKECPTCHSKNLKQDEDVLDTWFSSWLWPFATLGWPKKTPELKYFYPTSALFTASEIIFFWVARMIMAGLEFTGEIPFKDVYIHGTVRDDKGRKMSKSLGNAIDPLEIINEYGADALRFSLIINSGQDLFISKDKFEIGRNFANKIWNASRLILMNAKEIDPDFDLAQRFLPAGQNLSEPDLPSRWIVSRYYSTLNKVEAAIEKYRYSEAETLIQEFFWGSFCDVYLEVIKKQWNDPLIQNTAVKILELSLKMMHPFIPFVTEELWQIIKSDSGSISVERWPAFDPNMIDEQAEASMQMTIDLSSGFRNTLAEKNLKSNESKFILVDMLPEKRKALESVIQIIAPLIRTDSANIIISDQLPEKNWILSTVIEGTSGAIVFSSNNIDQERIRIQKEIEGQRKLGAGISGRLSNEAFVQKAPPDVIAKDKERLVQIDVKVKELEKALLQLE